MDDERFDSFTTHLPVKAMKIRSPDIDNSSLAVAIAPEDLRRGDFVALLSEIIELPSFFWCETPLAERDEMVRLRRLPTAARVPLKIKAICLPFVFVKLPSGEFQTVDLRLAKLARLQRKYARTVWKAVKAKTPALEL